MLIILDNRRDVIRHIKSKMNLKQIMGGNHTILYDFGNV